MREYLKIQLKYKLLGKKNLFMLVLIILLTFLLTYVYHLSKKNVIYNVAVLDEDNSQASKTLIRSLDAHKEIFLYNEKNKKTALKNLKRGKYDIVYTINKDFEKKLKEGNFKKLVRYDKEETMKITSWLNDYIGLKILKQWTYFDIYKLINKNVSKDYSYEDYKKQYKEEYASRKIIDLSIKETNKNKIPKSKDTEKIYLIIIAVLLMYISMSFGKEIIKEKDHKIIKRLKVAGINRRKFYFLKAMSLLVYALILIVTSILLLKKINVISFISYFKVILNISIFVIINYLVTLIFIKILKDEGKYLLGMQIYILVSILLSLDIFKGTFKLINEIGRFVPLNILIENVL